MFSESFVPKRKETEAELAMGEMMSDVLDEFFEKAEKIPHEPEE